MYDFTSSTKNVHKGHQSLEQKLRFRFGHEQKKKFLGPITPWLLPSNTVVEVEGATGFLLVPGVSRMTCVTVRWNHGMWKIVITIIL
ncbi:Hypothetical protein CINCED_3A010302 [Cinara cedri]|uniref:Uncharacterized protein n=1 Tax=Cinara cedri TaxID=506608 RepID=A0A5E4NF76_9HEMI|nr:Hypothetical protein CINCED_3A010302 [Cinara cedri]